MRSIWNTKLKVAFPLRKFITVVYYGWNSCLSHDDRVANKTSKSIRSCNVMMY